MADWRGMMVKGSSERSMKDEDFQEEVMWDVVRQKDEKCPSMKNSKDHCLGSSSWLSLTSAPRTIPRAANSPTIQDGKSVTDYYPNGEDGNNSNGGFIHHDTYSDDEEDLVLPPHEYIAKRLARSGISCFSVCEGVGRTLKGRDLSKVRNAILTKTGFLE